MEIQFRVREIYGSGSCIGNSSNYLLINPVLFIILDHVLCPVDAVALKTTTTTIITEQLTQYDFFK